MIFFQDNVLKSNKLLRNSIKIINEALEDSVVCLKYLI